LIQPTKTISASAQRTTLAVELQPSENADVRGVSHVVDRQALPFQVDLDAVAGGRNAIRLPTNDGKVVHVTGREHRGRYQKSGGDGSIFHALIGAKTLLLQRPHHRGLAEV